MPSCSEYAAFSDYLAGKLDGERSLFVPENLLSVYPRCPRFAKKDAFLHQIRSEIPQKPTPDGSQAG
jgi:hypothetical protein